MNKSTYKDAEFFYGASPEIFKRALELRKEMTDAEKLLWEQLRKKQLNECRFRRQHPINKYIADFYCHTARLVIEVDGGIHKQGDIKEYDEGRQYELEQFGLQVIRFTNEDILNDIKGVVEKIRACLPSV